MHQTKAQKRFSDVCHLLAQGKSYKAQELAEKFGCSRKTISNDLKPLVAKGVVRYEAHYYTMLHSFVHEYKEQHSQLLASMMHAILQKDDLFYFDFELEEIEDPFLFTNLSQAIQQAFSVNFFYTNRKNETSSKTVAPLKIGNFEGSWYLVAYDLQKESIRIYHMLHIKNLTLLEEEFLSPQKRKALQNKAKTIRSPWFAQEQKKVTLYAKDLALLYIKRKKYHFLKILKEEENKLTLEMYYYQDIEVLNFVKSWLPYVVIVDDVNLQTQLKKILLEALSSE
jgi:predicted DNA-binding transcriptional regulator YafY